MLITYCHCIFPTTLEHFKYFFLSIVDPVGYHRINRTELFEHFSQKVSVPNNPVDDISTTHLRI